MPRESGRGTHRWGIGLLLVTIGLLLFLSNQDVLDLGPFFSHWWPLVIILVGLWKLMVWGASSIGSVILLIVIGILCMLATWDVIAWSALFRLWPLVLIAAGAWLLLRPSQHRAEKHGSEAGEDIDFLDAWALFGGAERQPASQQFKGGNATALFGGIDIDLREAQLAEGEHSLHLTALFGGIDIFVPQDWDVTVTGTPIFGALEDKRRKASSTKGPAKGRLHISGFVMFGGIEVKN